jgi:Prophage minor tail protein Z (GPZ)
MITIDAHKLQEVEERLGQYRKKAPVALYRAINRAAENLKSNAAKEVRNTYVIKAGEVKSTITISRATSKRIAAAVISRGHALGLEKFRLRPAQPRHKKPPKSLKVQVRKDTGLKNLLGAFVASVQGNKVFERAKGRTRRKKRSDGQWTELPIKRLFGPPVPIMLENEGVRSKLEAEAAKVFEKRLEHEIKRTLEGNG